MSLYEAEMEHAQYVICFREIGIAKGNYTKAAAALGIHRNTLSRIMKASGSSVRPVRKVLREGEIDAFTNQLQSDSGRGSNVLCPMQPNVGRIGPRAATVPLSPDTSQQKLA